LTPGGEEHSEREKGLGEKRSSSVDDIPLLVDEKVVQVSKATGVDLEGGARDVARERKAVEVVGLGS